MSISNLDLQKKCKRFLLTDPKRSDIDLLIRDSLITANREMSEIIAEPLAWNREIYDELFTRYYATISAITAADPGVITADSVDPDLDSDHGFQTGDIVYLTGVNGENTNHRLNERMFRAVRIGATTLSLKTMDGESDIDTSGYDAYDTGGTIYHAGFVLPRSTIEPTGGTADYEWDIKRIFDVQFDLYPSDPVTEAPSNLIVEPGGRPRKWRYQQYAYAAFTSTEHILFFYNLPGQRYNVRVSFEKVYPDLSTWTAAVYPPHPAQIHDFIWHRALANLAMHSEKQRRRASSRGDGEGGDNTKIEILNAQYWINQKALDELSLIAYNRKLGSDKAYRSQGMRA